MTSEKNCEAACKAAAGCPTETGETQSELKNWPIQIKLVPVEAPYFDGCDLLIAADCTAYACGSFHGQYMKDKVTLIGCPKLDGIDYSEKLAEIFEKNNIKSVTVTRMVVPCCGGIEFFVNNAIENSGKNLPVEVVTFNLDGTIAQ